MKKYNYKEVKDYIESLGYKLLDSIYICGTNKLTLIDSEGYYLSTTYYNIFLSKRTPMKFIKYNPYTIQNIKLWLELNNKQFELLSNEYINAQEKLQWKCKNENCKETFNISWNNIYSQDQNCPFCSGQRVGLSNCLEIKNQELAKEWHPTLNGDLTPYDVTYGSGKEVWWKCKECGYEWSAIINNRNNGNGCPECAESRGEMKISEWLKFYKINYQAQKMFNNLLGLGGGNLSYDFYLQTYNLLIEYQGKFHDQIILNYKDEPRELAEARLVKQKEHDKLKKEYAKNNNIKLLEIWYWDFDNIEEILNNYLN